MYLNPKGNSNELAGRQICGKNDIGWFLGKCTQSDLSDFDLILVYRAVKLSSKILLNGGNCQFYVVE